MQCLTFFGHIVDFILKGTAVLYLEKEKNNSGEPKGSNLATVIIYLWIYFLHIIYLFIFLMFFFQVLTPDAQNNNNKKR